MWRNIPVLFLFALLTLPPSLAAQHLGIYASPFLMEQPVSSLAIEDVRTLLAEACNCEVALNPGDALVRIELPDISTPHRTEAHRRDTAHPYPYFHYPEHGYTWNVEPGTDGSTSLTLETESLAGVSCGLYGLLQERLGFAFYHPRETKIPDLQTWPLTGPERWEARPRFEKKGFHLHTQHPLELTEALMLLDDRHWPDVKEYIDWLARNQQNYFEYNLLEGIDRNTWPKLARRMVGYLHDRGIIAGIDLSLHMTQQKSFMLYENPPTNFRSKAHQIRKNVAMLFTAPWDVWNVEFSTTEFTGGNIEKKKKLQHLLNEELIRRNAKMMGRAHVVKKEEMIGKQEGEETFYGSASSGLDDSLDRHRGIMSHTVMFYTAFEEDAPVYGNENLQHMLELLKEEQQVRETWYYPESAYWITFDTSVPLFLMPYLKARLEDILLMDSLNVQGHLTFSSGWEWGYWLIDWSIARWSWAHSVDGVPSPAASTQFLGDLIAEPTAIEFFSEALALQQHYLKDRGLIEYLVAQTVTDEMPPPLDLPLHPRPEWKYKWLMNDADSETLDRVTREVLPLLQAYADGYAALKQKFGIQREEQDNPVVQELLLGLDVAALRAIHRKHTLEAIIVSRLEEIDEKKEQRENWLFHVEQAAKVRQQALALVREQEQRYRYDLEALTTQRWDHTAYHFGYLFTVHDLHFWEREEMQVRKNKWGPLFMNIWNIPRIIGLTN